MATIKSSIELYDAFTAPMMDIIQAVNMGLSAMENLQQGMNQSVDTASIDGARDALNQATEAAQALEAAMQGVDISEQTNPVQVPVQPEIPDPIVPPSDPVTVPVQWQSENFESFLSSGTERFQQEIQSANSMMDSLNQKQAQIAATAASTSVLPSNAVTDINNVGSRLQAVQQRIQQIENNPLNIGTDTANAALEQMRGQLAQALEAQNDLNAALDNMDVSAANTAYSQLSQTIGNTERFIRDNVNEQGQFNQSIQEGVAQADKLTDTIKGAVTAYISVQSIGKALDISDQLTLTTSRLDMMNDGVQSTAELVNMVYAAAQDARGSFSQMADVVARFGNNAKDAFSSSEEVVAFADLIQKQMTIAGASTQEAANAELQLSQALGSGVLRGDELNSIFEQAPNLIQNVADYLNVPIGQIREMAADGELSADIVKTAIFSAADDINSKFESMPMTWSQIWQSMQNTALIAFQPVLQNLNDLANSDVLQASIQNAIGAISALANILLDVFDLVVSISAFVSDNWGWIAPIVWGIVAAFTAYNVVLGIYNGIQAVSNGLKAASAMADQIHAAALMMESGATFTATAAQYGFNAALLACPVTWIVAAVLALIVILYALVGIINQVAGTSISATGLITGAVAVAGAFILNIGIGLYNSFIAVIAAFVNFFIGIIEWVLNAANGGFNSFGDAVANLIGQIISWFLSLGQIVTTIIDAIFGTDWTAGLEGLKNSVTQWGKNENAITLDRMDTSTAGLQRFDYGDAASAGYDFGAGLESKVGNLFNSSGSIPSVEDYAGLIADNANLSTLPDIADNTGKIKDTLSDTDEDLKYLRDMAEMEVINRYTTAEIKIEQNNHNTVNNGMDLDGVVSALTDGLMEAIEVTAEGVHD
jgi:tape measure domain-containing protein